MQTELNQCLVEQEECLSIMRVPIGEEDAAELARSFAALADPARLRLFSLIATQPAGEVCACELVRPLGKSQPTVSHHLRVLYEAGLVEKQRRGRWIYYWPVPNKVQALLSALQPKKDDALLVNPVS